MVKEWLHYMDYIPLLFHLYIKCAYGAASSCRIKSLLVFCFIQPRAKQEVKEADKVRSLSIG